jgi:hypothetical protein
MSVLNCCIVFISDKRADGADAMVRTLPFGKLQIDTT